MSKAERLKIVLASGNAGKVREFSELLGNLDIDVLAQSELGVEPPEETGLSFVENAIIKARAASEQTGLPAIADDSGIAVDALKGAPGIYSARYAGTGASDEDNVNLLLQRMTNISEHDRAAQFHCVLVYVAHAKDPTPLISHGRWEGQITETKSGQGGFGYDPIFWVPEFACTAAELTKEQKNSVSHRGKACQELLSKIRVITKNMGGS